MKKMKFRKLSRVLISISLLAIIAVSLISVPVSAAHTGNFPDLVGQWRILDNFGTVVNTINMNTGFNVSVRLPFINSSTGEIDYVDWGSCKLVLSYSDIELVGFSFLPQYSSGDFIEFRNDNIYYKINGSTLPSVTSTNVLYDQLRVVEFTSDYVEAWSGGVEASEFYDYFIEFAEPYVPPQPRSLLDNILGTFSEVGSWIGTIISSLVALFWSVDTASLTFLGILSVAGLAFSVIMLLFGIVTRFVGFSG